MKMYEKETSIGKFANDHIDFLLEGDYDGLRWRVDKFAESKGIWKDEVYGALLEEAIKIGEVGHLDFICDYMHNIPLLRVLDMESLRDVDVPVIEEW